MKTIGNQNKFQNDMKICELPAHTRLCNPSQITAPPALYHPGRHYTTSIILHLYHYTTHDQALALYRHYYTNPAPGLPLYHHHYNTLSSIPTMRNIPQILYQHYPGHNYTYHYTVAWIILHLSLYNKCNYNTVRPAWHETNIIVNITDRDVQED